MRSIPGKLWSLVGIARTAPAAKAKGVALQICSVSDKGSVFLKNCLQGEAERIALVQQAPARDSRE
jgi:hypothetical protein